MNESCGDTTAVPPRVSVIIPAYNAAAFIDEALRSVLDQDYPNLEVIVIDDGSTDETAERLAAYASQALCIHQPNSGGYVGAARNAGMARATGEYLAFLDADDIMLPGRIRRQVDFLSTHPEVGLVFSDYRNFSRQGLASTTHFEACALIAEKLAGREAVVQCRGYRASGERELQYSQYRDDAAQSARCGAGILFDFAKQ